MIDVEHVARLAMLELSVQEQDALAPQLEALAQAVRQLPDVPLPPAADPVSMPLRADEPAPSLCRDAVLQNAAHTQKGFFLIET